MPKRDLVNDQHMPNPNEHPACWDLVIADVGRMNVGVHVLAATQKDMQDRDAVGFKRYNTRLQPYNGRDSLVDAYQEALDLCVYLRTVLYEFQDTGASNRDEVQEVYDAALLNAVSIRSILSARDGE